MEFRDVKAQYQHMKTEIDEAVLNVMQEGNFISGYQVNALEEELAEYVGVKHCITCGNGTDALILALMAWNIGKGDAVFVPDFTFFATAEAPTFLGAIPVFVDVDERTFNISPDDLDTAIQEVINEGKLVPKAIIAVDLFGQPAEYQRILEIAKKYNLLVLEDGAQGFGGRIGEQRACSFGDIATTSFFPAKPLGCYGDGGAVFTDNDEWAKLIRSYQIHGKGTDKYDNVRIGMNSRLDTIQAAVLRVKLEHFQKYELKKVNEIANKYTKLLGNTVVTPMVLTEYYSSWAQYSILLKDEQIRNKVLDALNKEQIPTMIYYRKGMHEQSAFSGKVVRKNKCENTIQLEKKILALPINLYSTENYQEKIAQIVVDTVQTFDE